MNVGDEMLMKEKIERKIESIIDYIVKKPDEKITADDYMILSSEVRDIRFREAEEENREKIEQLVSAGIPAFNGFKGKEQCAILCGNTNDEIDGVEHEKEYNDALNHGRSVK